MSNLAPTLAQVEAAIGSRGERDTKPDSLNESASVFAAALRRR